jgi:hypothetical protein
MNTNYRRQTSRVSRVIRRISSTTQNRNVVKRGDGKASLRALGFVPYAFIDDHGNLKKIWCSPEKRGYEKWQRALRIRKALKDPAVIDFIAKCKDAGFRNVKVIS